MRFCFLITIFIFSFSSLFGFVKKQGPFLEVPLTMRPQVEMLMHFDGTRSFLNSFDQEPPITLQWISLGKESSNAFWSVEKRMIALNASKEWEEGEMIYSILFELHNAKASEALISLDKQAANQQITKSQYVESVERVEYQNVLETARLLEEGVDLGYFPKETYIPAYPDFPEHFRLQVEYGHSAFIAAKYDALNIYPLPQYLR